MYTVRTGSWKIQYTQFYQSIMTFAATSHLLITHRAPELSFGLSQATTRPSEVDGVLVGVGSNIRSLPVVEPVIFQRGQWYLQGRYQSGISNWFTGLYKRKFMGSIMTTISIILMSTSETIILFYHMCHIPEISCIHPTVPRIQHINHTC